MSETDELAHWLRTLANIPLLNVEISDRYTAAADALEQAQKQLDQAYGDIASIRDDKNRRIAELEAAAAYLSAETKDAWDKGRISVDTFHAALAMDKVLASAGDRSKGGLVDAGVTIAEHDGRETFVPLNDKSMEVRVQTIEAMEAVLTKIGDRLGVDAGDVPGLLQRIEELTVPDSTP